MTGRRFPAWCALEATGRLAFTDQTACWTWLRKPCRARTVATNSKRRHRARPIDRLRDIRTVDHRRPVYDRGRFFIGSVVADILDHAHHLLPRHGRELANALADGGGRSTPGFTGQVLRDDDLAPEVVDFIPREIAASNDVSSESLEIPGRDVVIESQRRIRRACKSCLPRKSGPSWVRSPPWEPLPRRPTDETPGIACSLSLMSFWTRVTIREFGDDGIRNRDAHRLAREAHRQSPDRRCAIAGRCESSAPRRPGAPGPWQLARRPECCAICGARGSRWRCAPNCQDRRAIWFRVYLQHRDGSEEQAREHDR